MEVVLTEPIKEKHVRSRRTEEKPSRQSHENIVILNNEITFKFSWLDIMFLPFNYTINCVFNAMIILSTHIYLYILCFDDMEDNWYLKIGMITLEVLYLARSSLFVLHRIMKKHREKRTYKPVATALIFLDFVSLIPVNYCFEFMDRFTWVNLTAAKYAIRTNSLLRLLRIVHLLYFYKGLRAVPVFNQTTIVILFHLSVATISAHISAYFYCSISACYRCQIPDWTNSLETFYFDEDVMWDWIVICFVHHFTVTFNNAMPIIMAKDKSEILTVTITMMVGFILHHMYFFGSLTSEYINVMKTKHMLKEKLQNIERFMVQLQFPDVVSSEILKYYKTLWNVRKAIIGLPEIAKVFPRKLKNEILTDIYWEAMMHSHICTLFDDAIKREMSTYMKTETYMSGQYVIKRNQLKHKMFYVSAGIIEVMSSESETLPILFLSSGTVLGEFSCVRPTKSKESVRCSTACTLQSITYVDICKLLRNHPEVFAQLRNVIDRRIKFSKDKIGALKSKDIKRSHIHWIKFQWRRISKKRDGTMGKLPEQLARAEHAYTSRFLDLLVLSSKEELKVHTICIRGQCSFVLEEHSSCRRFLDYVFLLTTVIQIFLNSYFISFAGEIVPSLLPLTTILDFIYLLDLYVQSITAATVQNVLIAKPFEVLLYRCKQISFLIDVAASIPYCHLARLFGFEGNTIVLLRAPKLLKIYKILQYFVSREVSLEYNIIIVKSLKYLFLHIFAINLFASIVFMTNCFQGTCIEYGWLMANKAIKETIYNMKNYAGDFLETWYYTISVYFSFKLNTEIPSTIVDLLVVFFITAVGFYVTALSCVQVYASSALSKQRKHVFSVDIDTIEEFIKDRRELRPLRSKILDYKKLQWQLSNNVTFKDISKINGISCSYLKEQLQFRYIQNILSNTKLFHGCGEEFLKMVTNITELFVIPSGYTITLPNRRCVHLYIMVQGYCAVKSIVPGDLERNTTRYYGKFSAFPVVEFFNQIECFLHVKTVTEVQILTISFINLHHLLKMNPAENHLLKTCLEDHLKQFRNIITRTRTEYLPQTSNKSEDKEVATFNYVIFPAAIINQSNTQKNTFTGKYRHIANVILWRTYDPTANFFVIYESIRCILIFVDAILLCLFFKEDAHSGFSVDYIIHTLDVALGLDFYVKSHLQYYNSLGIKVTHPLWTLKNYLKTSFFVDLISMFPYDIGFNQLFYEKNNVRAFFIYLLISRPMQLYRPYFLMSYLRHEKFNKHATLIKRFSWMIIVFTIMGCLSCWAFISVCSIGNDYKVTCAEFSWLVFQKKHDDWAQRTELYICFYLVTGLNTIRSMKAYVASDYIILILLAISLNRLKIFYTSKIMGGNIFGNTSLSRYQDSVKNYLKFIASRNISNDQKLEFLQHYQYVWKQSKFKLPSNLFKNYFPFLKEEIYSLLYEKTLKKTEIFKHANSSLIYILVPYLTERYYAKDAHIIRCNDVVDEIFIVYKGEVDVYIAGHKMAMLGEGSIFGNFDNKGYTRQTIDVYATVHVKLLCLKTSNFYKTLEFYPVLRNEINLTRYLQIQYMPSVSSIYNYVNLSAPSGSFHNPRKYWAIDSNNIFYKIYCYISNVHISALSSILSLYFIVVSTSRVYRGINISLDVYFFIYILVHCHVTHTDPDSGIVVMQKRTLMKLYLKSARFYIDIITITPIYLIYQINESGHAGLFLLNKLLRMLNLYEYYHSYALLKNVPRHLRWVFLIYMTIFSVQIMFSIWWILLDPETLKVMHYPVLESYLHICNILTATAVREIGPSHYREFTANIIIIIASHWIFQYLTEAFFTLIVAQNNNSMDFRNEGGLLKIYCETQAVSRLIVRRSWEYLIYIYNESKCEQMPKLLEDAPGQIKEGHLIAIYGQFFQKNPLFENVHIDFLRQLIKCVQFCIYLPGATIVESGDQNGQMYFIEKGKVLRIDNDLGKEILGKGQSFGEVQGIEAICYKMSYKAMTICHIISVQRNDWFYLLDWFPATKEILFQNIKQYY